MQTFKYFIKTFYSYDKTQFKELDGVVNFSLSSQLNSLYEIAKIRVARTAFKIAPVWIKCESSHFKSVVLKVSEILAVDDKAVEIIAKTDLNLPKNISKYGDFANLGVECEFRGELSLDTLPSEFEIASFDDIENKLAALGVRFWCESGKLVFHSEFGVSKDAVKSFDESEILSLNVNSVKNERISEIIFNASSASDLYATPKITLIIDPSPQPVSPLVEKTYTNEENGDTYIISPISGIGKIFTSLKGALRSNIELKFDENYTAVEEFECENDDFVELAGYIKELNSVMLDGKELNFIKKQNDDGLGVNFWSENMLCFATPKKGALKVSYKTGCYFFRTEPLEKEASKQILLNFYNAGIDFAHKYTLQGYYPLGLEHKLSIIKDFNYDSAFIPRAKIRFGSAVLSVDDFGEVDLVFNDYGNYEAILLIDGVEAKTLYISYFANEFKKDFNVRAGSDDNT